MELLSGSIKRARAHANQVPSCMVDGCTADLSKCRDYHRRHKVCEIHSKTPMVTIRGLEQRFCQQCSRFHSLVEFDEGKRSCRKRLDGHNRRRRKPQPDFLSLSSRRFLPSHQGATFLPFSGPQGFSTSAWIGAIKAETDIHSELSFGIRSNMFPGQQKNFPFLQTSSSSALPPVSALSLLSSQLAEAREIGLGRMVQCDQQQQQQSLIFPNLCYNNNGVGIEGEQDGSLLSFDGSSYGSSNNFQGYGLDLWRSG